GRVIQVRVEVVAVLKRPSPSRNVRALGLPVSADRDLLVHHPFGRALELRMVRRESRLEERVGGEGGIPHGREARLGVERGSRLDAPIFDLLDLVRYARMSARQ